MGRAKKVSSRTLALAGKRLDGIRSISETLDLGEGLTFKAYEGKVEGTRAALGDYNTALAKADAAKNRFEAAERELADWNDRMLGGVVSRFGKDSDEYEKAGGTRKSERKRPVRQPKTGKPA